MHTTSKPFRYILLDHYRRYPRMQVGDLYKLIYQGTMGSEHAVEDKFLAKQWLEKEVAELLSGPTDPLIDPISENGEIVRVHLRPFIAKGGNIEGLLEAFVQSAVLYKGSLENLEAYWSTAQKTADDRDINLDSTALDTFFTKMKASGFPAIHHSAIYKKTYKPSYRVIHKDLLNNIP